MKFSTIYFWTEGKKQHLEIINGFETYGSAKTSLKESIELEPGKEGVIEFREQPQHGESLFIKYEDGRIGKIVGYGDK